MKPRLLVPPKPLALVGLEVCTPLGWNAEVSCAELAANSRAYAETEVEPIVDEPVVACRWSAIRANASRTQRMMSLAATALAAHLRAVAGWGPGLGPLGNSGRGRGCIPVVLAQSIAPREDSTDSRQLVGALRETANSVAPGLPLEFLSVAAVTGYGRTGWLQALTRAVELLESDEYPAVLIGAVDSFCDDVSLVRLEREGRVVGPRQREGLIPGEAAGFGLVTPLQLAQTFPSGGLRLLAVSWAEEPRPILDKHQPSSAEGLTRAFRLLREQPTGGRAALGVYSCQTQEGYWAEEFSKAYLRNVTLMPEPLRLRVLGAELGDVGAAAAAVQFAMAQRSARGRKDAEGEGFALVYACSDAGLCAACTLVPMGGQVKATEAAREPQVPSLAESRGRVDAKALRKEVTSACEGHTGELGFLLSQRSVYFTSPERVWSEAGELERRVRHHFHALRAWGRAAREYVLSNQLAEDDSDSVLGAVFFLASLPAEDTEWTALLRALVAAKEEQHPAWELGLQLALAEGAASHLTPLLSSGRPAMVAMAARVMAYRAEGHPDMLLARLESAASADSGARAALCAALAALSHRPAAGALARLASEYPADASVLRVLHVLGDDTALTRIRRALAHNAPGSGRLALVLALAGAAEDAPLLLRIRGSSVSEEAELCAALGTCGTAECVEGLLARLSADEPEVGEAAAEALKRISGAGRNHSRQAEDWRGWWCAQRPQLEGLGRIRLGRRFALEALWDEATLPSAMLRQRQLVVEELAMRLGPVAPLRADAFVEKQHGALEAFRAALTQAPKKRPAARRYAEK